MLTSSGSRGACPARLSSQRAMSAHLVSARPSPRRLYSRVLRAAGKPAGYLALAAVAFNTLTARADAPATAPSDRFGPISYFETNCARCHGSYGANYLPELAAKRGPEKMREVIDQMCSGPAQAPLEGVPLQLLIDYHQSMSDGRPYVAVTKVEADRIEGEVTPDAKVNVQGEGGLVEAKVDGDQWSAQVTKPTKVTAVRNNKVATTQP